MRTKITVLLALVLTLFFTGCKEKEEAVVVEEVIEEKVDLINDEFPEAKAEVAAFMVELKETIMAKDVEKLISYHAYGPKFTEFQGGKPRNGSKVNEENERGIFGSVTEIQAFDFDDMKIAVYDNVANVTFHSNFQLLFGEDTVVVNDQITLLLVRTDDGWKFVHEHHSPLVKEEV